MKKDTSNIIVAEPWETTNNPVRNTNHQYLRFINTAVFSEPARFFLKHGYYTSAPYGSKDWIDYWDREEERCLNGYSVGGVRITGRHYFFLNYSLLKARPIDPVTGLEKDAKKIITFPRFLDHQYYLFHEIEECFAEGPYKSNNLMGIIIAKSRRKGISFVNSGGVITYNYNFVPSSLTTIAAYEAVHYNTLLNGTHYVLNHLNKNTDWAKRRQRINRRDHFRASFVYIDDTGIEVEDGFMSEVQARSFKDDPFKAIGDSTYTMCFEECLGKGTKVLMANGGFKNVEEIVVGDLVMGVDSKPKEVISTTSGIDNMFKVKQQKGIDYIVNSKHKLYLEQHTNITSPRFKNTDGPKLLNVEELEKLVTYKRKGTYGIKSSGIEFEDKSTLPIEPYLIGLWLGDGEISRFSIVVNTDTDNEILEYLKLVDGENYSLYKIKNIKANCTIFTFTRKHYDGKRNVGNITLRALGVLNNKHIPKDYLITTRKNRLELLAGLIDTDGYLQKATSSKNYSYEIIVKKDIFAEQVVFLARSLGFYTRISKKRGVKNGKTFIANRIVIRGKISEIPVKVKHKQVPLDWSSTSNPLNTQIVIEPIGKGEYFGFTLKGNREEDHLFLLEDFTITHNCGRFKGLLDAYTIAEPTFRDGDIMTGVPMLWGCLPKGQKVWKGDGDLINIEDITKNDGILSHKDDAIFCDQIDWLKPPFIKPCYRITTSRNTVLECSEDHPILWSKKSSRYVKRSYINGKRINNQGACRKKVQFKNAKDICKRDQIAVIGSVPIFGKEVLWEPRIIGMLIGDGSYGFDKTPVFSNCDSELLQYIEDRCNITTEKEYITTDGRNYKELRIRSITKYLREAGIYGQVKSNKQLPKNCFRLTAFNVTELLGGLFDTDGYVNTKEIPTITLDSISNELLRQVKNLLIKIGVHCTINTIQPRKRDRKITDSNYYYRLVISDIVSVTNFALSVKLLVPTKRQRLETFLIKAKESTEIRSGVFVDYNNNQKTTVLRELRGIRFETVKSIEYIGEKEVYNLRTTITHNYLANNIITHNTGGDVEAGGKDLEEMFYNPSAYGLKSYQNIYDENAVGNCGWFIDDLWYMPGLTKDGKHVLVDEHGNSYRELSEQSLDEKRTVRATGSRAAYRKFVTQQPKSPKEAFLRIDSSPFDTLRAQSRLTDILTDQKTYISSIYTARFTVSPEGVIKYEYDATNVPLREFPIKDWNNVAGCPEIYEHPIKNQEGNITPLRYIAGIDSYDADKSTTDSVGSMLVLDRLTDRIVCHYKGRPSANTFYETCRRILKYYNATANYERANKGIYGYFYNMRCLHLLCDEPEILKEKGISKANTIGNNLKGTAPSLPVNAWGRELAALWSESPAYGEDAESEIVNMNKIRSLGLLREILSYNDTGNFDDISALGMLMIYRENLMMTKVRKESKTKSIMNDVFWKRHTTQRQLFTQR